MFKFQEEMEKNEIFIYNEFRANTDEDGVVLNIIKDYERYTTNMIQNILEYARVKIEETELIPSREKVIEIELI